LLMLPLLSGLAIAWTNIRLSQGSTDVFAVSSTFVQANSIVRLEYFVDTYCFTDLFGGLICDSIKAQNALGGVCGATGYAPYRSPLNPYTGVIINSRYLHTCVEVKCDNLISSCDNSKIRQTASFSSFPSTTGTERPSTVTAPSTGLDGKALGGIIASGVVGILILGKVCYRCARRDAPASNTATNGSDQANDIDQAAIGIAVVAGSAPNTETARQKTEGSSDGPDPKSAETTKVAKI